MTLIDINGYLLGKQEVESIFPSTGNIKCFRWQDSSFVKDDHVKVLQDVIDRPKVRPLGTALDEAQRQEKVPASPPASMGPTDPHPPTLHLSTSEVGIVPGKGSASSATPSSSGSSHVDTPCSAETPSSPPLAQAQGPTYHHVPHSRSNSTLSTSGKTASNPPWKNAPSSSSSNHSFAVHSPPRPPRHPPNMPDSTGNKIPPPPAKPGAAKVQVRTLRGAHKKLTYELADGTNEGREGFSPCERRSWTGGRARKFCHDHIHAGRPTARRRARYASSSSSVLNRRYTTIDSPIASPNVCAGTTTIAG
jgi:hypothetical protein